MSFDPAPQPEKTWSQIAAMERSHQWQVYRGIPANRSCKFCGDTLDTGMRYCPGSGGTDHTMGDE